MAKAAKPKKSPDNSTFGTIGKFIIELTSRFGITGMLIVMIVILFFTSGTDEQKRKFIDMYILLDFPEPKNNYAFFVVIPLVILYFITAFYYRKRLSIQSLRIKELERDYENLIKKIP